MLNLNAIMSVIFNVPAAIFSTVSALSHFSVFARIIDNPLPQIVACRAVRRLTNFSTRGPEVLYVASSFVCNTLC